MNYFSKQICIQVNLKACKKKFKEISLEFQSGNIYIYLNNIFIRDEI